MEKAIAYLLNQDAIFENINKQYGVPIQPKRPQGFETLVLLILEQQVSIDSAKAAFNKLKIAIPDFSIENLFVFSDENFRSCGVSRQKAKYIKALAEAILSKELDLESFAFKDAEV
ncbi:MAG: DNA-3-methyladenine glycosylase 2 family protein, partial [Flavobacterium sp.]|nr:DNA-3-methyladenine glycosylase 2 family protein [Flavobacterium sp.]